MITTEDTKRLAYCHVPKVASSAWMLTFAEMNHLEKSVVEILQKKLALHGMLMTNFSILVDGNSEKEITDMNTSNLFKFVFMLAGISVSGLMFSDQIQPLLDVGQARQVAEKTSQSKIGQCEQIMENHF